MPGFFKVPNQDASVSRSGYLFLYKTNTLVHAGDFPKVHLKNQSYAGVGDIYIHVCVADTFLRVPDGAVRENLIINHKDGRKWNNILGNLEYTTHSGNIKHAYETGLRTDNVRLKAKNIETGEVMSFLSIGECARFFKINNNRVFGYINRKIREAAFLGTHLLVKEEEEFPSMEEARYWKVADNRIPVIAFNKETAEAVIYQTATHAAKEIGVKQQTLNKKMKRAALLNTYVVDLGTHLVVPVEHGLEYMKHVVEDRRQQTWNRDFRPPVRVKPRVRVTDTRTKVIQEFENIYEMARYFGLRHETIMKKRKANNGMFKGHLIELL
jgi:hypothetical protein